MRDQRIDRLAEVLVKYSVGVRKGDVVLLRGPVGAKPLLIAAYREVLRAGGHPVLRVRIPETEEVLCKYGDDGQLSYIYPCNKKDMEIANGLISAWAEENTKAMSNVEPAKQALISKARKPILETLMKRSALEGNKKFRWVGTQFPCNASAQDAEMSLSEYEDFVFRAGLLHLSDPAKAWQKIGVAQQRVCDFLEKAREIRFIAPGTDLRCGIAGRKWINCDGRNNFPDGEVFTAPIEDATEGEVHYSYPAVFRGQEVQDVRLRFRAGKVVDATAAKGEPFLHEMLEQDKGAKILGEIAIGTNYAIKQYTKNTLFDEKIGGTFHAALGAAYPESGGKNKSALHWDMVCNLRKSGRIEADGKEILKNGRFLNGNWPKPMGRSRR
jgi:aminopeptidase